MNETEPTPISNVTTDAPLPSSNDVSNPAIKVERSWSGHQREVDDTIGAERIKDMHKSGTYTEVVADGSKRTIIHGRNYTMVVEDDDVVINGHCNLIVLGDCNQTIGGNHNLTILGDQNINITGTRRTKIGGNDFNETNGDYGYKTNQSHKTVVGEETLLNTKTRSMKIGEDNTEVINGNNCSVTSKKHVMLGKNGLVISSGEELQISGKSIKQASEGVTEMSAADFDLVSGDVHVEQNVNVDINVNAGDSMTAVVDMTADGTVTGKTDTVAGAIFLKEHIHPETNGHNTDKPTSG